MKPKVYGPIDGNAFAVMGAVVRALRRAGQADKVAEYLKKATSSDYNHLLVVSMDYVDFELDEDDFEAQRQRQAMKETVR